MANEQTTTVLVVFNGILALHTHVLIAGEITSLRSSLGSQIEYLCDPVLGDCGRI
jgi:pyridoxal/pyridoxine/pyridoxamine kinase